MNHSDFEDGPDDVFNHEPWQEPQTDPYAPGNSLRHVLREHLLALPYRTFLLVIAQLLERQGSRDVQFLGRNGFVGRNQGGGWDLEATLPSQGVASGQPGIRCVIQVKQFDDLAVHQRTVDELRGCCLRAGAGQGLLVTTSRFSPVAVQAAASSALAPISLIDGECLLDLLMLHGMGIVRAMIGQVQLDPEFFQSLILKSGAISKEKVSAAASAKRKKQTNKSAESLIETASIRPSPETKLHQGQTTVLHFSVIVDAQPGDSRRKTKARAARRND